MRKLIIGLAMVAVIGAAAVAWHVRPQRSSFYTDAQSIREPVSTARIRDILWQPPQTLDGIVNTGTEDYEPRLSADGLTLFFVRGKAGGQADIFSSRKTFEGWSDPQPIESVNSPYDELGPEPSADGQSLYFYSDRPGGRGGYDLWVIRQGENGWQEPTNLGPNVNSEFNDYGPAVTPDGSLLYFASNRPQHDDKERPDPAAWSATLREDLYHRDYDLYSATVTDRGFGVAEPLGAINTPHNDGAPAVSPFGDFLYFSSDRPGGEGGYDLYRTRRIHGVHEPPTNLGRTVNTSSNELDPALSLGGYGLHFSSDRLAQGGGPREGGDYNLFYTTSREVFRDWETQQASIDWRGLWGELGPNLMWALLALLLLLLLLALLKGARDRKLSLLARCLLASLLAHLVLMLLLNLWGVTSAIADAVGRGGRIEVALLPSVSASSIETQIRGQLTDIVSPDFAETAIERRAADISLETTPTLATLTVSRPTDVVVDRPEMTAQPAESRPEERDSQLSLEPVPAPPIREADLLKLATPDAPAPVQSAESEMTPKVTPAEPAQLARAELSRETALTTPNSPRIELRPQSVEHPAATPADRSLVEASQAIEAATDRAIPVTLPEATRMMPVESVATTEFTAPSESANRIAVEEAVAPTVENVAPAPSRQQPHDAALSAQANAATLQQLTPAKTAPPRAADLFASAHRPPSDASPVSPPIVTSGETEDPPLLTALDDLALPQSDRGVPTAEVTEPTPRVAADLTGLLRSPIRDLTPPRGDDFRGALIAMSPSPVPPTSDVATSDSFVSPLVSLQTPADRYDGLLPSILSPTPPDPAPHTSDLGLRLPTEEQVIENKLDHRSPTNRRELIAERGGSDDTERAVALALKWLAEHQSPDGRWDGDGFDQFCDHKCGGTTEYQVDTGLTGLAALCFLGANHTHISPGPYRENVERGVKWLLSRQGADGDLRSGETMYSHGIAAIALSEAYAMTGDPRLVDPVRRAMRFIHEARDPAAGGWRYDPGQQGDTSVLGWQVMALRSAQMGGIEIPAAALHTAREWLDTVASGERGGLYAYQPGHRPTESMTAEAMFTQQLLGRRPEEPRMNESAEFITRTLPDWETSVNTYYWYYATLALCQHQGYQWKAWNDTLTPQLVEHQIKAGSSAGSWDPEGEWADIGGRVYQTALCTLMLEVYYRYLPLYGPQVPDDAIGTLEGFVTDAVTGRPLEGAEIRLVLPDTEPRTALSDSDGSYVLHAPSVPDFFALSASLDGYVPASANVETAMLHGHTLWVDFELTPQTDDIVALEPIPDVHHLGDNAFTGSINSQFQKRSEGDEFSAEFDLTAAQLAGHLRRVELSMLAKGVQREHPIRINGRRIGRALDDAPDDGSFGEFLTRFDPDLLRVGPNTLHIHATAFGFDIDDFEFVNVQIRLIR